MEQDPTSVCRICQADDAPIIRPCQCEGTMAYAHPYCLAEWIASRGELSCEVCGTAYTLQVAIEDVPPLTSLRGLQLAANLLVARPLRRLCGSLSTPLQVLVCCLVVLFASTMMWHSCLTHVMLRHRAPAGLPVLGGLFYVLGALITAVPVALLWVFEQFRVWVFLHEDYVVGLPPETPMQPPANAVQDDAATSALNEAFTRCNAESQSASRSRYLSATEAQISKDATLQLLKAKVRASRGPAQRLSSWNFGPARYAAKVLFVHMMGVSAVVLGHVTLSTLESLCHGAAVLCRRLLPPAYPSLHLHAATAVTSAVVPPYVYWVAASVVGLMEWPLILRAAARCRRVADGRLSRSLFLSSLFTRSAASLLALFLAWAIIIPVIVYACLFPFFVEGDLAVLMERRDAWQVLRTEHLLPLRCDSATRASAFAVKPLVQPINVARALFTVLPDVWRGVSPPLFDAATCGAAVSCPSAHPSPASLAEFMWYSAGVLIRISTFSTWLTLIGSMQTTLLWLLTGTFAVLSPYTLVAQDFAENEFFFAFLRLHGGGFWRTLLEVPLLVAVYTVTVGFGAFAGLHHLFPETLPKSLTYLPLYSPEKQDMHFHFLYCWLSILKRLHTLVRRWLSNCFLYSNDNTPEMRQRGSQVVERAAYAVCLVGANMLIGAAVEWASWNVWFPFFGFAFSIVRVLQHGGNLNAAFPQLRRGAQNLKMQAVMLCFYGVSVDFTRVDTCMCRRLVHVKSSRMVPELRQRAGEKNDTSLLLFLSSLADFPGDGVVVCSRDTLRRLTTETAQYLATLPRLSAAAILAVAAPLVVCSQWHLNYVDRLAADYVALPFWFCLLLRWATGALAVTVWVLAEGALLRTSLFHRYLEYAPQLIQGPPSLEAVHAVLLPSVLHGGLVRFVIGALTCLSDGNLLPTFGQMSLLAALLLLGLSHRTMQLTNADWGRLARFQIHHIIIPLLPGHVAPPAPPDPTGDAAQPVARNEDDGAALPPQEPQMQQAPQPPPAHDVAAPKPQRAARLRARFARWMASQTASDVVLVAYPRSPAPQSALTGS
ncbi:hypothetical protein, conserved [Leishmania donovani]|uniref:RING-variant domain family protein n=1 Tax=Leishmania donovani TaxID=5661 RepID=E9BMC6_LEIDO|nr:hypothetical protein, conserved [Leishmania donovani]TPP42777.1 RING-variant domain family protein [Leishmania donovani]CBZ36404.1 hypothetical protein, conserved [Leishmania donovani]